VCANSCITLGKKATLLEMPLAKTLADRDRVKKKAIQIPRNLPTVSFRLTAPLLVH
jgi:hypothetical protein